MKTDFEVMLKELFSKVKDFEKDFEVIADTVIEEDMADYVRFQLLEDGTDGNDKLIQEGYSPAYALRMAAKGLQVEYVDLYFTGKFQNSFKVMDNANEYFIESGVDYEEHLIENYGEAILEVNEQNLQTMFERIKNETIKYFLDA